MDPIELLRSLIAAFENSGVDFGAGGETADERIARLEEEIAGGRDVTDVLDSLILEIFQELGVEGKGSADATRIAGELEDGRTAEDLFRSIQLLTAETLPSSGDPVLPSDATQTLVRITDPSGSDASVRYVVQVELAPGIVVAYNIGDQAAFDELFPGGTGLFDTVSTVTQDQFSSSNIPEVGNIDELFGQTETVRSQFQREMDALTQEGLAGWIADDPEAIAILTLATREGWSTTRQWAELSKTQGFADRFGAVFDVFAVTGETVEATINRIVAEEESIVNAITSLRPNFTITTDYLQSVMVQGWNADEVVQLLTFERAVVDNPTGLAAFNSVLASRGVAPVDESGLLLLMAGQQDTDLIETANEALVAFALEEAGVGDQVSVEDIIDIIDDATAIRGPEAVQQIAQQLALSFQQNATELNREAFGLQREDVVAALFGEESPTGRSFGEIISTLSKFERERRAAAQGFGGAQGFVNQSGAFVIPGLSGL